MDMTYNRLKIHLPKSNEYHFTLNMPKFLVFKENTMAINKNEQFNFNETYYYLKGKWTVTLKLHNGKPYYSKEKR